MELQDPSFKIIKNFKQGLQPNTEAFWEQDPQGPHEPQAHEASSAIPSQKGDSNSPAKHTFSRGLWLYVHN